MRTTIDTSHYPEIARPVVAMAKAFPPGAETGWHSHERGQLIFAVEGLMVANTENGTCVVPSGHALWVPPTMAHNIVMRGAVSMRTVYISKAACNSLPPTRHVLQVSRLLEAVLIAMCSEPVLYDENGRGGYLAALVLDEISRTPSTPFALAVPDDPRLARLARALIADPGSGLTIDGWADHAGVSRRTLTRLFRHQTGLTFRAWRRRLRLLQATARLADGEPLARVAAQLGYTNIASFRNMARREYGQGPTGADRSRVR